MNEKPTTGAWIDKEVRSGSGRLTGTIFEVNWPWIHVRWSDDTVTWSDSRLFPELASGGVS